MKKTLLVSTLVVALIGIMPLSASALPIEGAISFSGTSETDVQDLKLAEAFKSFTDVVVSNTGGTGDYAPVLSGQPVTFNPFKIKNFTPDPLVPLWTFLFDEKTYSFEATGLIIISRTGNTIGMYGPGIAHITGFDDTPGDWYFSANNAGQTASFSASTIVAPVPEPATMLLLGAGLIGIGTVGRRRLKKQ